MFGFEQSKAINLLGVAVVLVLMLTGCVASPAANDPVDRSAVIEKAKTWTGSDWLNATDAEKSQIAKLWNENVKSKYGRDLGGDRWSASLTTFYLCGNIEDDPSTECNGGKQGSAFLSMTVHMALENVCAVDLGICPDDYYDESSWK